MMSENSGTKPSSIGQALSKHPVLILLIVLIIVPWIFQIWPIWTDILLFGLFAMAFNILLGQTGILSFGHATFFGLGGYITAMFLMEPYAIPRVPRWMGWIGIIVGVLAATAGAIMVGALGLRRRGTYFALITLAFSQMFYFLFFTNFMIPTVTGPNFTGGDDGIIGVPTPPILTWVYWRTPITWYYFVLLVFISAIYVLRSISTSPAGEVLKAIRDNEQRVKLLGYNTDKFKLISFIISGLFSGLAGSLYTINIRFAHAAFFSYLLSGEVVIMTLFGGMGTFFGPFIGAIVYILLKDLVSMFTMHWMIIVGAIVMVMTWLYRGKGLLEIIQEAVVPKLRRIR